jgi:hypothetical protein
VNVYDLKHWYRWSDLEPDLLPFTMANEQLATGCVGFIPVFDTAEHAQEWGKAQEAE